MRDVLILYYLLNLTSNTLSINSSETELFENKINLNCLKKNEPILVFVVALIVSPIFYILQNKKIMLFASPSWRQALVPIL